MLPEDVARQGDAIFERDIRSKVEANNRGRFLILDVLTGDYEIDGDDLTASDHLLERKPAALLHGVRIGEPAAYRIGHFNAERS